MLLDYMVCMTICDIYDQFIVTYLVSIVIIYRMDILLHSVKIYALQ